METDYFTNEYRSKAHVRDVFKVILHFTQQAFMTSSTGEDGGGVRIYNLMEGVNESVDTNWL